MTDTAGSDIPYMSRADIEKRAEEVRQRHGLLEIPVNPVVLANSIGIKVHNAKFSDETIVGMIAKRGSDVTLLVNQSDRPARKRFTIAHELGHHFLHLLSDGDFVDAAENLFRQPREDETDVAPKDRKEIQANMFAAALLMPATEVKAEWEQHKKVDELARKFNVSAAAMGIRLNQLGLT